MGTEVFEFWQQSINRDQSIFALSNVTNTPQQIKLADINLISTDSWVDLITDHKDTDLNKQLILEPYQSVWISNQGNKS